MIDFIKSIIINTDSSVLEDNTLLDFCYKVNPNTGQIRTVNKYGCKITPYKDAHYKGLTFKIYDSGRITVEGSLHKYYNSGKHNYNDFTRENLNHVLIDIKRKFKIKLENFVLSSVEVGVNIIPPLETTKIIGNCYFHRRKKLDKIYNSDEGTYYQCKYQQYIIKLYDKARHYRSKDFKIPDEIMRFEIKHIKMQKINKLGVKTLFDLQNLDFKILKKPLLKEWENVLYYENTIRFNRLSKIKEKQINNYSNPKYWETLKGKNFTYHLGEYKKIVKNFTKQTQNEISQIINNKVDELNTNPIRFNHLDIGLNRIVSEIENYNIKNLDTPLQKQIP